MFIFNRSILGPLAALLVSALIVTLQVLSMIAETS